VHIIGEMASELIHLGAEIMATGGSIDAFINAATIILRSPTATNTPRTTGSVKFGAFRPLRANCLHNIRTARNPGTVYHHGSLAIEASLHEIDDPDAEDPKAPVCGRSDGDSACTSAPLNTIEPLVTSPRSECRRLEIALSVVVFPAVFAPRSATIPPLGTFSDIPLSTKPVPPFFLVMALSACWSLL
jgi:hypothetical protein